MNERLLQFIWQFQYFNFRALTGELGERIQVIHPGIYNTHQGPDFLEAKIKVDNTVLVGSVELHIKASDWLQHKHSDDANYQNVILHVVWENNQPIARNFATLCLQPLVSTMLLQKYQCLLEKKFFVPCQEYLPCLGTLAWLQWKERTGVERLARKAKGIILLLQENKGHWEEVFWQLIAKNFGLKINNEIFFLIAKVLPIKILAKHKNQIHQLEAMLLGITNLLPATSNDAYIQLLQREYAMLCSKFSLQKLPITPLFLRMRPAAFPSIRLAQLAMLIHTSTHLFTQVKEANSLNEIRSLLHVQANDYWHYHYRPGDEAGKYQPKKLGTSMVDNIIINTIIPAVFAYGEYHQLQAYKDKALQWLQLIAAENNTIITAWKSFGVTAANALESQALIELKNNYCDYKLCLQCHVGKTILLAP